MAENVEQPAERKRYEVVTPQGTETVVQLTEEDAKAQGIVGDDTADADADTKAEPFLKARSARNKARSAESKS